MTKINVSIDIDTDKLAQHGDMHLALLWHVAQANPAPTGDPLAGLVVGALATEIVRRWLRTTTPELHRHQERSYYWSELCKFASYEAGGSGDDFYRGQWHPDEEKIAKWKAEHAAASPDEVEEDVRPERQDG